jgi:hypothetical protein
MALDMPTNRKYAICMYRGNLNKRSLFDDRTLIKEIANARRLPTT